MRSARRYFRLHLSIAAIGGLALVASAWAFARSVQLSALSVSELVKACRNLAEQASLGSLPALALFALTGVALARALRPLVRQLLSHRRFQKRAGMLPEVTLDGVRVRLIDAHRPHAFCAGLLRPRVYLSTGAQTLLRPAELRAVVAHEDHHARRRDPLRLLVSEIVGEALFFLPVLRRARRRYADLAEMAADEAAVRATGGPGPLAAAMLRFDEHSPAGVVGIATERVDQLLGQRPRWELSASLLSGAAAATVGVLTLTYAAATTPAEGVRLSVLVMQVCGIAMFATPVAASVWLLAAARRGRSGYAPSPHEPAKHR